MRSAAKGVVGLQALKSKDGFHFSPLTDKLIITDGYFDSENLAFWDAVRGEYRAYFRDFQDGLPGRGGIRAIKTATSDDFINWSKGEWLQYPGAPKQHLYTNQVTPYARAPHIFIGFPNRYTDRGWVDSTGKLPGLKERQARTAASPRYGSVVTDSLMMTSRDGLTFKRWGEAIIRPGPARKNSWTYGDNLISWGILPTRSDLPQAPDELSIYAIEGYWNGKSQNFRRYSIRVDGFVSVQAPLSGGEFTTKPISFSKASNWRSITRPLRPEVYTSKSRMRKASPSRATAWMTVSKYLATRSTASSPGKESRESGNSPASPCDFASSFGTRTCLLSDLRVKSGLPYLTTGQRPAS